jgi:thiamine-monophosphate kinase
MADPQQDRRLTVAEIGEHGLLNRLRARVPDAPGWVTLGIGDDAAVVEPSRGELDVLTTDALVEGVHFRRDWTAPDAIGHKALAVNLSDLAAMGAAPRAALLSLALPADMLVDDFDSLVGGFLAMAAEARVPLVGGNITRSPGPLMIDVTLMGSVRRRRVLTRRGARDGDALYVTGVLGGAATGLAVLETVSGAGAATAGDSGAAGARDQIPSALAACVSRYERPRARIRTGISVARNRGASACVDLSDGLADAVRQVAQASGLGAVVDAACVPVDAGTAAWAESHDQDAADAAIAGGEDYELLFALAPKRRRRFLGAVLTAGEVTVTRIGRLTREPGIWCERNGQRRPLAGGFRHF